VNIYVWMNTCLNIYVSIHVWVSVYMNIYVGIYVATPLWGKCEVATHTLENGTWESFGILENSKRDCRGQNTLHWSVFYTVGKVLKFRCPKWPRMNHLDILNTSYCWKKGQEPNWQFDFRPLKVENRPDPGVFRWSVTHRWKALKESYNTSLLQTLSQLEIGARSYERSKSRESKPGQFWDFTLGVSGKNVIRMQVQWRGTENTIWGKVVASPESRPWWVKWIQSCMWLVLAPRVFQNVN